MLYILFDVHFSVFTRWSNVIHHGIGMLCEYIWFAKNIFSALSERNFCLLRIRFIFISINNAAALLSKTWCRKNYFFVHFLMERARVRARKKLSGMMLIPVYNIECIMLHTYIQFGCSLTSNSLNVNKKAEMNNVQHSRSSNVQHKNKLLISDNAI